MIEKTVSVIIPTYRRKKLLKDVVACLEIQTVLPLETFIIDSSPHNDQLDREEVNQLPSWVNYETCENIKNIPWKKNLAIPKCKGDIILFLDDDVLFNETLIEDYLKCYIETNVDGISGLVLLPEEEKSSKPVPNNEVRWLSDAGPNVRNLDKIVNTKVICTANFSINRKVLLSVGGFDEQIRGTWDDTELGYRLAVANYNIIHHPKPEVVHLKPNIGGSRDKGEDIEFSLTNIFYFHIKHATLNPTLAYFLAIWKYCRPGRRWLRFKFMICRIRSIFMAIKDARRKIKEGPIYLKGKMT